MNKRLGSGIALLSLLAGSGWVFDQAAPGLLQGLLRVTAHDGLLACGFALLSLKDRDQVSGGVWWKIAIGAVVLLAVPQIVFAGAGGHVASLSELLVFLLVPAVVVVVVAQQNGSFGADENPLRLLLPAVAGLGGAALILPFYSPTSAVGWVWLAAVIASAVMAGIAAVRLHDLLQGVSVLRGAAVMCGAVSVATAAFCWLDWQELPAWSGIEVAGEALRLAAVELPILLLTVWLLRDLTPVRFSARSFLVVLAMVVESLVAARPGLTWTTALGIVLLAGGAVGLLQADSR